MPPFQCCCEGSSAYHNRCKGHSQNQKQFNIERLRNYLFSLSAAHTSRVKATWKERERVKRRVKVCCRERDWGGGGEMERTQARRFTGETGRYVDLKKTIKKRKGRKKKAETKLHPHIEQE